jgi:hypothetical protein
MPSSSAALAGLIRNTHEDLCANREAARLSLSLIREHWSGTVVATALQAAIMGQAAEAERLPA